MKRRATTQARFLAATQRDGTISGHFGVARRLFGTNQTARLAPRTVTKIASVAHVSMVEIGSDPLVENIFVWVLDIQPLHLAVQGIAADLELPCHIGYVPVVAFQFANQRVALR